MKIDKSIFELPEIKRSISRIDERYSKDDCDIQTLWLRVPWEPGQPATTFTGEDKIIGCIAIYDPLDGRLV